jgi:hypothetical protein
MTSRSIATVTVVERPQLHPDAIRVEIECLFGISSLTRLPGLMQALTVEQMITAAVFEHESKCGRCDTEAAHLQGDRQVREITDRAWHELLVTAQRRHDASRRN